MMQHLVLEAFGEFTPGESLSVTGTGTGDERDDVFLRMFDAYARVMGWASASSRPDSRALWNLRSAELASPRMDDPRVAWVWVSLRTPHIRNLAAPTTNGNDGSPMFSHRTVPQGPEVNLADAVPALVSCLQVSLERLGALTSTGFQLTCLDMNTGTAPGRKGQGSAQDDLMYALPYLAQRDSDRTQSVLAFDERLVAAGIQRELLSRLGEDGDAWPFVFGPPALIVEQFRARTPLFTPRPGQHFAPGVPGLLVEMPEWSAEAAGWVLAFASDVAREAMPGVGSFAIRLTRRN